MYSLPAPRAGWAGRGVGVRAGSWRDEFGGGREAVGGTVILDGEPFAVIGVGPVGLRSRFMAFEVDAWVPIGIPGGVFVSNESEWDNRSNRDHGVVARLAPGVSMEQASAQLEVVAARLHSEYREDWEDQRSQARRFAVLGERAARVPPNAVAAMTAASSIFVLAAGLLLAVACFNVAGIMANGLDYFKHLMGPLLAVAWLILPMELIGLLVRPLSLSLRLLGNLTGDHLVLGIFSDLVPYVVPAVFLFLGIFVSFIQAFVFSLLSVVYVSLAVASHDDH